MSHYQSFALRGVISFTITLLLSACVEPNYTVQDRSAGGSSSVAGNGATLRGGTAGNGATSGTAGTRRAVAPRPSRRSR